jgi:hypothetical protein
MTAAPTRLSMKRQSEIPNWTRSIVFTVEYLGCLITVRSEMMPGAGVRGSYEIVPISKESASVFEDLGIVGISSDAMEAPDPDYICEWAKCEIDFLLEEPF